MTVTRSWPVPTVFSLTLLAAGSVLAVVPALWPGLGLGLWLGGLTLWLAAFLADALMVARLEGLTVERELPGRLALGVAAEVRLKIRAPRRLPVVVVDEVPAALIGPDETERGQAGMLVANGWLRLAYSVLPRHRGVHRFGPVNLLLTGPLNCVRTRLTVDATNSNAAHVFPRLDEGGGSLESEFLMAELGLRRVRRKEEGTEFESLREANPGDELRRIDWRATARRGRWVARNYEPEKNQEVLLCLDTGRLMGAAEPPLFPPYDLKHTKLDFALKVSLRLAAMALRQGDRVGLMSYGRKVGAWVAPNRGRAQLGRLLEAVYELEAESSDANYRMFNTELRRRQKKRALVVVLTDFIDMEASSELLACVASVAKRHAVLFVALKDPRLAQWVDADVKDVAGAYRGLVSLGMERRRAELVEQISRLGVEALDAEPSAVSALALNSYLALRARQ